MSAQLTAYAELLKICSKHSASKALFDDVAKWAQYHTQVDPNTFKVQSRAQKWTRKKTLASLRKIFKMQGLEPCTNVVTLHDDRKVTVPNVDFAESMRSILNDKDVMKRIMQGLDPKTWRPTASMEEREADLNDIIKDKDSGWLYQQGIKLHCPDETECNPELVRPFPVVFHIDKSHSDLFGNLAVAPIQCMPAMLDVEIQQYSSAWRQIATIPNLSSGKGKDGKKSKDAFKKLEDYHKVMSVALSSFRECYEAGGFMWKDEDGREILLKPYIHMIVGDIAGVNEMVGHYNTCHANCVVKDCKCNHEDLVEFPPKCSQMKWSELQACNSVKEIFDLYAEKGLVSERDMSDIMNDKELAKSISKHPVTNAFDSLPLSDPYQGLIGMTPQEMLHMMGCGIFKYLLFGIKDIIGENSKNSKVKGIINDLFPDIRLHLMRNAERDISRMSNRNGFFNVTSLTNSEIRGNFFGLVTLMHTTYGEELLRPYFSDANVDYDDMLETCCLVLAWEQFYQQPQKRDDLMKAEDVTIDLMKRIYRDIPRTPRSYGRLPSIMPCHFSLGWYSSLEWANALTVEPTKNITRTLSKLMQSLLSA